MQMRDTDAKLVAISANDANKIGITKNEDSIVTIDGNGVDLVWVNELDDNWSLDKLYLKIQAYISTLRNPQNKQFVNVYSNKIKNFERLVNLNLIEGKALDKVCNFLVKNSYDIDTIFDELVYGKSNCDDESISIKDLVDKINSNIRIYNSKYQEYCELIKEMDFNSLDVEKVNDARFINSSANLISDVKILVLSIYRDLLLLKTILNKNNVRLVGHNSLGNCVYCHDSLIHKLDKNQIVSQFGLDKEFSFLLDKDSYSLIENEYSYFDNLILDDQNVTIVFEFINNNSSAEYLPEIVYNEQFISSNEQRDEQKEDDQIIFNDLSSSPTEIIQEFKDDELEEPQELIEETTIVEPIESTEIIQEFKDDELEEPQELIEETTIVEPIEPVEVFGEKIVDENSEPYTTYIEEKYYEPIDNSIQYSSFNDIQTPVDAFDYSLNYSNENIPLIVNFVSKYQENIIKKHVVSEYVNNKLQSETIRLSDEYGAIISDTVIMNDSTNTKQYHLDFDSMNITKHYIDGDNSNNTRRIITNESRSNSNDSSFTRYLENDNFSNPSSNTLNLELLNLPDLKALRDKIDAIKNEVDDLETLLNQVKDKLHY